MSNIRISPSGQIISLDSIIAPIVGDLMAEYLKKVDVQIGRFIPSAFQSGAGARALLSKASGPDDWLVESGTNIILPAGKYLAVFSGLVGKGAGVSCQLSLASTTGGINMAGFNIPTAGAYSDLVTMPAVWEAPDDGEALYMFSTTSVGAPTQSNSNIYVLRLGT